MNKICSLLKPITMKCENTNQPISCKQCENEKSEMFKSKETSSYKHHGDCHPVIKRSSLSALIKWNLSKACEKNGNMDVKMAMELLQTRLLDQNHPDISQMIPQSPEERNLVCALLAWNQLGHKNVDSLCNFVEHEKEKEKKIEEISLPSFPSQMDASYSKTFGSGNITTSSIGPVLRLPHAEPKIVMRIDDTSCSRPIVKMAKTNEVEHKIEAACCIDSDSLNKLAELENAITELRSRAVGLAKREAQRVELLERAESAWKDLERGYQRRLAMAEEKEDDITKQIQKMIEDRNTFKKDCTTISSQLKEKGEAAEKDHNELVEVEQQLYEKTCTRLRLSEEVSKEESALSEVQCKVAQLERDLQFKEDQARRKLKTMQQEEVSARVLTHETERVLRGELNAIKEEMKNISQQLLDEDALNISLKQEIQTLTDEKNVLFEDLEGCKLMCDGKMQSKMDDLIKKREELAELKEKVFECKCRMPIDASVQAKRTASLAVMCNCLPEDKILESCSCSSLRSSLLSNLLSDLFSGLQSELGMVGAEMPCQLLKCLEDKHNWDRPSVVMNNLRRFFSKLLVGELDIAIATSIEKYHAKWIGACCANAARTILDSGQILENVSWEERAIGQKAQSMATKMAEEMFKERAEELTKTPKAIVASETPSCQCGNVLTEDTAIYSCGVMSPMLDNARDSAVVHDEQPKRRCETTSPYWRRTRRNNTQMRVQIEDPIKIPRNRTELSQDKRFSDLEKKETYNKRSIKKKPVQMTNGSKKVNPFRHNVEEKSFKKQTFSVNLCLCDDQQMDAVKLNNKSLYNNDQRKRKGSNVSFEDIKNKNITFTNVTSFKLKKSDENNQILEKQKCLNDCICFQKNPSNTSIYKLLNKLEKWKINLNDPYTIKRQFIPKNEIECENENEQSVRSKTLLAPKVSLSSEIVKDKNSNFKEVFSRCNSKQCILNQESAFKNLQVPTVTESEHMGTINLEKSCDNVSKRSKDLALSGSFGDNNEKINVIENSLKLISSNSCMCQPHKKIKNNKFLDSKTRKKSNYTNNSSHESKKHSSTSTFKEELNVGLVSKNSAEYVYVTDENINELNNSRHMVSPNNDYYIKLLGVTLMKPTDGSKDKNICNNYLQNNYKNSNPKIKNERDSSLKNMISPEMRHTNLNKSTNYFNIDYFKEFIGVINKENEDTKENVDKGLDVQSLCSDSLSKNKSCVCCIRRDIDKTSNIKINAFHLLEDHIKQNVKQFKKSHCLASCIPTEEEKKLYFSVIEKVKEIISTYTDTVKCNCAEEEQNKGNWNRAYSLLEEYLKIKIKRIQCSCFIHKEGEEVLPAVIKEICALVQNDIRRLKKMCKCNKNIEITKDSVIRLDGSIIPEKNISDETNKYLPLNSKDLTTLDGYNCARSFPLMQSLSCQVPYNLEKESKSCDVLSAQVYNSLCTQTSYICNCNVNENIKGFVGNDDGRLKEYAEITGNDYLMYTSQQKHQNETVFTEKNQPYIGCTVDCSCDPGLSKCVCSKSIINKNRNVVNSFWRNATQNIRKIPQISYILNNSVPVNIDNLLQADGISTESPCIDEIELCKKNTCDVKICTNTLNEQIVLKQSKQNISSNSNETSFTNLNVNEEIFCSEVDSLALKKLDAVLAKNLNYSFDQSFFVDVCRSDVSIENSRVGIFFRRY